MAEYRTGNCWHRHTIIRVGTQPPDEQGRREDDQPVAWVDSAAPEGFAGRICELLNAPTPDVPYTNGAREALAEVRRRLSHDGIVYPADAQMLRDAAAELGVDGVDQVSASPATQAAEIHPGVGRDGENGSGGSQSEWGDYPLQETYPGSGIYE